ncbi:acyl-CoA carboxylase subunit epsilon [Streptosporangium fragile]|uniref:acyl-CoA carboxylase subunit epsilon n=1 Tax=Streptosporangium fragile TaxID=46186 RepID=UPI003CD0BAF9
MSHLKIIKGDATPEEIAAVVIALSTRAARTTAAAKSPQEPGNWRNPSHRMRKHLVTGQGAWRASALPR